jgi:hypothetical protein
MRWTEHGLRFLPMLMCVALTCGVSPAVQGDERSKPETDRPLATANHETGLVVEIMEVKLDEHEMMLIRWRYRNPTDKPIELLKYQGPAAVPGGGPKIRFLRNTYYSEGKLQTGEAYRVGIVKTADNKNYRAKELPMEPVVVRANKDWEFWAYFPLPQKGHDTITLHVPGVPAIEGLAVPKAAPKK